MQIDLPVHQAAGGEEVLNRIDAFGLYYQVVILYIQHLDNAGGANVAFGHSGIEAVAAQVVQAVHIQLPAYQLVQEALGVFILENLNGECQLSVHFLVDTFHQHQGDVFVGDALHDGIFQYVGEGSVADVVHQDSGFHSFGFAVEDKVSFGGKLLDGLTHQVEGSQRVLEPCMLRTGIYDRGQPQLLDTV